MRKKVYCEKCRYYKPYYCNGKQKWGLAGCEVKDTYWYNSHYYDGKHKKPSKEMYRFCDLNNDRNRCSYFELNTAE